MTGLLASLLYRHNAQVQLDMQQLTLYAYRAMACLPFPAAIME